MFVYPKVKSSTMEPCSQDTFTSVYSPLFLSINFGLQPLPSTFHPHDTHSLLAHACTWAKKMVGSSWHSVLHWQRIGRNGRDLLLINLCYEWGKKDSSQVILIFFFFNFYFYKLFELVHKVKAHKINYIFY